MTNSRLLQGLALFSVTLIVLYVLFDKTDENKINQDDSSTPPSREILSYVPADTLFFFGGLESALLKDTLDVYTAGYGWLSDIDFSNILNEEQLAHASPAEKMLAGLFSEYALLLQDIPNATKNLGIGAKLDSAVYTVGAIPVLRFKLADTSVFNAFIRRAEQAAHVTPVQGKLSGTNGNIAFSSYSFDRASITKPTETKLIIAVNNNYAIITLATPLEEPIARNTIMGIDKPDSSLATTSLLSEIKTKYNFHPAYLGYINHQEIMNGVTASNSNDFSRMLDVLLQLIDEYKTGTAGTETTKKNATMNSKPLENIRTAECRAELMAIADLWPRTVFGYTDFSVDTSPKKFTASLIIESLDSEFLQDLKSLRGFIPAIIRQISDKLLIGFGLGINIDALMPFLTKTLQSFAQSTYKCELLSNTQQLLANANPTMAVGMMTGMAAGLQGISASILALDGSMNFSASGSMPNIKSIDALVTISSTNPQGIIMLAANFMGDMPALNIPTDGTPIDLPVPLPLPDGNTAKIAIKGKHLVAYVGDKAEQAANQLASETLQPKGLLALSMDLGKYMKLIAKSAEQNAAENPISPKELTILGKISETESQFVESIDISEQGIVIEMQMTFQ
ncbi:MAG: hypothetical protein GXP08_17210 [Gammaproteobacteria bacterium]|nr:hypothetical protein [Gammaproteobacteria bacterium]